MMETEVQCGSSQQRRSSQACQRSPNHLMVLKVDFGTVTENGRFISACFSKLPGKGGF